MYCIFDTGCTGMAVSPSPLDARYRDRARPTARRARRGEVGRRVICDGIPAGTVALRAEASHRDAPPGSDDRPWGGRSLDGHARVVLGLAFFEGGSG